MPLITHEETVAWAHCAQQLSEGAPMFDGTGAPNGDERCAGYKQQRVRAITETVAWTFIDRGGDDARIENSNVYLKWADPDDMPCPHCGYPRELADQLRPVYANIGGARGGPDQVFRDRKSARLQGENLATQAEAMTRQAVALEQLVAMGMPRALTDPEGALADETEKLRELVERQAEHIERLLAAGVGDKPSRKSAKVET